MSLTLNEYAEQAAETVNYPGRDSGLGIVYCAAAAMGEAGEMYGEAKKMWRDEDLVLSEARKAKIILEMGDILWYLTGLAHELGVTLEVVAAANLAKLAARYPERGISVSEESRAMLREMMDLPGT